MDKAVVYLRCDTMVLSLPISYERQMILNSNDLQQEHVHQQKEKIYPNECNSES
jgi:hypothetical protein